MLFQKSELEYCMVCGNSNPPDKPICECGGRNFVYGNDFTYKNKKLVCECGNRSFVLSFTMSRNPIYTRGYKCVNCGNIVKMQTYYESPYMD